MPGSPQSGRPAGALGVAAEVGEPKGHVHFLLLYCPGGALRLTCIREPAGVVGIVLPFIHYGVIQGL